MKNFLLDLWHDLRAKRLWPVALVLLAGIVAVPRRPLEEGRGARGGAAPASAAKAEAPEPDGPAELAEVKLEDLGQGSGSSLSSFDDPSNPFAPPPKVLDRIRDEADGDGRPGRRRLGRRRCTERRGRLLGGGAGDGDTPATAVPAATPAEARRRHGRHRRHSARPPSTAARRPPP